jgi:iron(III) transport system permease protein
VPGVGLGVAALGTARRGWYRSTSFPAWRLFEWALLLPMAMPAYVMAYTYTDFLQFVGPVQTGLRESFGWRRGDYWFPDVRTLGGAVAMFSCVLYPYVYLLVRTAFVERAGGLVDAARVLGLSHFATFVRVSLPLARPAIVAGVALALMETLADYGTVAYFAVSTFTTGIYRAWFSLGDRVAAAQWLLACSASCFCCWRWSVCHAGEPATTPALTRHAARRLLRCGLGWRRRLRAAADRRFSAAGRSAGEDGPGRRRRRVR